MHDAAIIVGDSEVDGWFGVEVVQSGRLDVVLVDSEMVIAIAAGHLVGETQSMHRLVHRCADTALEIRV